MGLGLGLGSGAMARAMDKANARARTKARARLEARTYTKCSHNKLDVRGSVLGATMNRQEKGSVENSRGKSF